MKRFLVLFSALALLFGLAGCQTKQYTPDVTSDFVQKAVVTTGDFSYQCKISRIGGAVTVEVNSTSAKGLTMTCDGKTVRYSYADMEYEAQIGDLEPTNPAIAVFRVFDCLQNTQSVSAKKTDNGYKYEGTVPAGKFILYQAEDNSYDSLHFLNTDILIEFEKEAE